MEIRLLGSVEVVVRGEVHRLPGAGERAVLALLALRAGRVAPADWLVDALWGEDLPANPGNALQLRVSKLRKALTAMGADSAAVLTRPPGYLLDVPPTTVDALRAVTDIQSGRELSAANDIDAALDAYRRALGAWRGSPLTEFGDADWAVNEARRLEELRLAATEEWIALELQAGRHVEMLDDLEALVAEHPLRERFHGLLMTALYRSGRQADALAAFQAARTTLEEELGLDPSPDLRELEEAILRQDEQLASPVRRAAPTARPNLPQRQASFVGRDDDVSALARQLDSHRLVTVTGPGGIGKTTVTVEAARAVEHQFPDGAWFVALAGVTDAALVPARIADVFGLPPGEPLHGETVEDRLVRQLGHRAALVVLDNCEHVIDAAARVAERLVSGCPHISVLATSREALAVRGEAQYALGPLEIPTGELEPAAMRSVPAVQLFLERGAEAARAFAPDDGDVAVVARICEQLDGMPLAIELAAARVKAFPIRQIQTRLHDRFRLLTSGPRTAHTRHQTLRATVDWSYQLLDEPEQVLFRRLGVFRSPWTLADAEAVCGTAPLDPSDIFELVSRLVDRSLIAPVDGRFRMLETIRHYAQERLREAGEHDAVMARQLGRLLTLAKTAAPQLRGQDQVSWLRRLREEHDNFVTALSFGSTHPDEYGEAALRLAVWLAWFWYLGDHEEGRRYLHQLLDLVPSASPWAQGAAHQSLAMVGRPSACVVHPSHSCAAAARASIPLLEAAEDARGVALSQILLAVEGTRLGSPGEALDLLDRATAALPPASWEMALASFVRMELTVRSGDVDVGIRHGDTAAAEFARLGDQWGVSAVRAHQGFNLRNVGRLTEALPRYEHALEVARGIGLHNTVQLVAAETGIVRVAVGDEDAGRALLEEAKAVARRYGYFGEGLADVGFGHLARTAGDLDEAEIRFSEAVRLLSQAGSLPYLAWAQSGLGFVREIHGDLEAAAECHREVLAVGRALPDPSIIALALEGLASVAIATGEPEQAVTLLGTAHGLRLRHQRPVSPLEVADVERVTRVTRAALGDREFDRRFTEAWKRGDVPDDASILADL